MMKFNKKVVDNVKKIIAGYVVISFLLLVVLIVRGEVMSSRLEDVQEFELEDCVREAQGYIYDLDINYSLVNNKFVTKIRMGDGDIFHGVLQPKSVKMLSRVDSDATYDIWTAPTADIPFIIVVRSKEK